MIHKLIDRFIKDMIERHPEEIISLAFPERAFRVLSAQLDKEIIVRSQEVDKAVMIRTNYGKKHFRSRLIDKIFASVLQENLKMIKEFKAVAETPGLKEIIQEEVEEQVQKRVEEQVQKRVEKETARSYAEGEILALQEALLDVLAIRFGKENGKVRRMVLALNNPKKLKVMHRQALKAKSLDPIVALLQKA